MNKSRTGGGTTKERRARWRSQNWRGRSSPRLFTGSRPFFSNPTKEMSMKKTLAYSTVTAPVILVAATITLATAVHAQQAIGPGRTRGDTYLYGGCGSSWAMCRYRANLRRNGEYAYRHAHNGNWSPAYHASLAQQRAKRPCNPGNVWRDACS